MKKVTLIITFLTLISVSYGQSNYPIRDYYNDIYLLKKSEKYYNEKNFLMAEKLMKGYKSQKNANAYYLKAKINFELNQPFKHLLDTVFLLGIPNNLVNPNSKFFVENSSYFGNNFATDKRTEKELKIAEICNKLAEKDQKNKKAGIPNGSDEDYDNFLTLDSLIKKNGWPTMPIVRPNNIGPAIVIAHQAFIDADVYEHYYRMIAKLCLQNKENWTVAEFILEQRAQYMASQLRRTTTYDTLTITFDAKGLIEENYSVPYFTAFSKIISSSSIKRLEFEVNNQEIADQITAVVYEFEQLSDLDPEIIKMLADRNLDHPTPITPDRIAYGINSNLSKNKVIYKFVNK